VSDFENLDYYDLLGVSRSASFDEIKRAYRREISKYHPDRFVNATPEEQAYASLRSQRLTEAYGVLSDFGTRSAYNRGQHMRSSGGRPPRPSPPPQQRDYQAELYDQAIAHLNSGRLLQAIGTLRQLQQINPFYRDSAELLSAAEAQFNRHPKQPARSRLRSLMMISSIIAGVAIVTIAAWALNARFISVSRAITGATSVAIVATKAPTHAPEPAASAPTELPTPEPAANVPTELPTPEPSAAPTLAPTEAPTTVPTAAPIAAPTAAPTEAPITAAEQGAVLLTDTFDGSGWADVRGQGWRVGYQGRRYHISSDAGNGPIWSYRTGPDKDVSIGLDLQVTSGEGGVLARFLDAGNYVSVVINPSQTSYRIEQQSGGATNVLSGGQSEAIKLGAEAINRLVIRLRGNHIQVFANGQQLTETDATNAPDTMRYGLFVLAKETAAEAFFDNLEIRTLE
jgi:hypothetical protein